MVKRKRKPKLKSYLVRSDIVFSTTDYRLAKKYMKNVHRHVKMTDRKVTPKFGIRNIHTKLKKLVW